MVLLVGTVGIVVAVGIGFNNVPYDKVNTFPISAGYNLITFDCDGVQVVKKVNARYTDIKEIEPRKFLF